eukprot:2726262-Amphidinium_carterae.1
MASLKPLFAFLRGEVCLCHPTTWALSDLQMDMVVCMIALAKTVKHGVKQGGALTRMRCGPSMRTIGSR